MFPDFFILFYFYFFVVLGIVPRVLNVLGKYFTVERYISGPGPLFKLVPLLYVTEPRRGVMPALPCHTGGRDSLKNRPC